MHEAFRKETIKLSSDTSDLNVKEFKDFLADDNTLKESIKNKGNLISHESHCDYVA